jgi:mono/diheme cytochrome c family protein
MSSGRAGVLAAAVTIAMALCASPASAQSMPTPPEGARAPAKDYYQRSLEIYEFRKAARSGPERGQEIYYFKCWFCHNQYTKDIPKLNDLYKRPSLVTGGAVNDDSVKALIRNGSANMPAYKYALKDEDLNDLVSFIKEKGFWDNDSPPLNPRFIAK